MKKVLLFLPALMLSLMSCEKKNEANNPVVQNSAHSFEDISFNSEKAYFSADGSMTAPVDSNEAKKIVGKIDLTFIYNYDYSEPGFFDPVARSQQWYWDDFYNPWLSAAVETQFYATKLSKAQFGEAKANQSKIADYFADTASMTLAPHAIFPEGSCIGGRETSSPESIILKMGKVYGFKSPSSGKRGLIYIRTDQSNGWPRAFFGKNTRVDIIREK